MTTVFPWLLPSLVALVLWGVSTFLPKLAVRTLPPLDLTIYSAGFFVLISVAVLAMDGFALDFTWKAALTAMVIGVLGTTAQIAFIFAIAKGPMGVCTVIASLYPVLTTALAIFFLDERLTLQQGAGICLGVASIIVLVCAHDAER